MALHYSLGRAPSQSTNSQLCTPSFFCDSSSHHCINCCAHAYQTAVHMHIRLLCTCISDCCAHCAQTMSTVYSIHLNSRSLYVVNAGGLLLHGDDSRPASLRGCGDAQLADQQDSKQLELLFKHERASQAQQPAAPRQNVQLKSPSQLDSSDMHHFPSSPARQQNKPSAILQSRGNQRLAFVEGCSDQASQEQLHKKSVGSCALLVEACPEDTSEAIAGKARSSLKGSNAWPPPSPSPKKPVPSPKNISVYPKKAACSQNRQPAQGLGVSQAATLQRHTDVMALHQRLRYVVMMAAFLLNMLAAKRTAYSTALLAKSVLQADLTGCITICLSSAAPPLPMLPFTQLVQLVHDQLQGGTDDASLFQHGVSVGLS